MEDKGRELLNEVKRTVPMCPNEEAKRILGEDCFLALETLARDFEGEAATFGMSVFPGFPLKVLKFGALVVNYFVKLEKQDEASTADEA